MNQQLIKTISEMIFIERQHLFTNPDAVIYHPGHYPELNEQIAFLYNDEYFKQLLIPNIYNRFLNANEYEFHKPILMSLGIPEECIVPIIGEFNDGSDVVRGAIKHLDQSMKNVLLAGKAFFCRRFLILATINASDKTFDVLPLIDNRGIDKTNWHTTDKGKERIFNEIKVINNILNGQEL